VPSSGRISAILAIIAAVSESGDSGIIRYFKATSPMISKASRGVYLIWAGIQKILIRPLTSIV
jgi:hypothetical protein